jgi:hypothetical protein
VVSIDGIGDLYRCPASFIDRQTGLINTAYPHYKNGYLPCAGGLLDQSATFLDAINIVDRTINRYERDKLEKKNNG